MLANGPGIQPPDLSVKQIQFEQLIDALHISRKLSTHDLLTQLRKIPALDLVNASLLIPYHEFRHTTDEVFIRHSLFDEIDTGVWISKFLESGVQLMLAECETEHFAFATWHETSEDSLEAVRNRLSVDYPKELIDALINKLFVPDGHTLPKHAINGHVCGDWIELCGIIYAELQVHAMQRAFMQRLFDQRAGHMVRRVRVGWRAKKADKNFPQEMGPTHGTDTALWFFGDGVGLELLKKEEKLAHEFCEGWWSWLTRGVWGKGWDQCSRPITMKYIDAEGRVSHIDDNADDWARGLAVWNLARDVRKMS